MKRKLNNQPVTKQPQKKLIKDGPDIPSSTLVSQQKVGIHRRNPIPMTIPQQSSKTQQMQSKPSSASSSLSKPAQKAQILDPKLLLLKKIQAQMPDKLKEELLGPNIQQLKQYQKKKAEKEKQIKDLIKKGIIQDPEKLKKLEEDKLKQELKSAPKKLLFDETGKTIDEKGNVIASTAKKSQALVNRNNEQYIKIKQMLKNQKQKDYSMLTKDQFFDTNVFMTTRTQKEKKKAQALNFIEKGSILKKAENFRKKYSSADITQMSILENSQETLNQNVFGLKRVQVKIKYHEPIPEIEWWDMALIPQHRKSYIPEEKLSLDQSHHTISEQKSSATTITSNGGEEMQTEKNQAENSALNKLDFVSVEQNQKNLKILENYSFEPDIYFKTDKITHMLEHPSTFKYNLKQENVIIPMFLTKQERKKIKRRKALEKERDRQDKIKLGLIKPDPPKLKMSNMMRILGNEAVADPSKIEKEVKQSVQERLKQHQQKNADKKMKKEQKADKVLRKLKKDSQSECRVALFRIEDLSSKQFKFKIDKNAQQLQLHGVCLIADKKVGVNLPSLVLVQGGPNAIKFYKKLMLRRIKWDKYIRKSDLADQTEETHQQVNKVNNKCTLIWEGFIKDYNFRKWNMIEFRSEIEARKPLSEKGVEYYWDMVLNYENELDD